MEPIRRSLLITGATGLLGQQVVQHVNRVDTDILLAARQQPTTWHPADRWVPFDLATGTVDLDGQGVNVLLHLASATRVHSYEQDVHGTRRLIENLQNKGLEHIVFISIVGVDRIPIRYFKIKRVTEEAIIQSGVPYTILRATQFHEFFTGEVKKFLKLPLVLVPGQMRYQPIETRCIAESLLTCCRNRPINGIIEIGGPEILPMDEAIRHYLDRTGRRKPIIRIPIGWLGKLGKAMQAGGLITNQRCTASRTWTCWLDEVVTPATS